MTTKALALSFCLYLTSLSGLVAQSLPSQSGSFIQPPVTQGQPTNDAGKTLFGSPAPRLSSPATQGVSNVVDAPIEVLTVPQDSASIAASWQAATGRRLAFTAQFQPLNLTRGVYTSSEYVQLLLASFETAGLEVYHVTDSLDYVRPRRTDNAAPSVLGYNRPQAPAVAPAPPPILDENGDFVISPQARAKEFRELDVIEIDAEIGSVTIGRTYSAGLDILAALDDAKSSNVINGGGWFLGKNQGANSNGAYIAAAAQPLSRYVKLLDQDSDYHSVSRPRMQCMSGETASISTGSRVAVPSSTLTTNFGGPSTSSNITYQNIALSLEVTPTLLPSGRIALLIKQTDNSISGTQVISGNTVPTIASQTFSTRTVVESGQLIALGGIRIDRNNLTKKGPTGLAKVPWIGRLFRVDGGDSTKSELLILLSARVGSKHR